MNPKTMTPSGEELTSEYVEKNWRTVAERARKGERVRVPDDGVAIVHLQYMERIQTYARSRIKDYLQRHKDLNANIPDDELMNAILEAELKK